MAPKPWKRPSSCGAGDAPHRISAVGPARSLETLAAGLLPAQPGQNPFAAGHAQFLQEQRQRAGGGGRPPSAARTQRPGSVGRGNQRERQREQLVLQSLERLEDKDTVERGVLQLEEVLASLCTAEELTWFLRIAFDNRRPLQSARARREQLMLLPSVIHRFHATSASREAASALRDKVLPLLVIALKSADTQDAAIASLMELWECLVPGDGSENPDYPKRFLEAGRAILQALLDPLALGNGWDIAVKKRCVTVLAALTPEVLRKAKIAEHVAEESDTGSLAELRSFLEVYAQLLVQALAVSPSLQEGLLHCLALMAADKTGVGRQGLWVHARALAELCVSHLTDTPSAAPSYAARPPERDRAESPPRGGGAQLTRELAMTCCACLRHLASLLLMPKSWDPEGGAADGEGSRGLIPEAELKRLEADVHAALDRDNINLHRLTRGNEPLRRAIVAARHAWNGGSQTDSSPKPPEHRCRPLSGGPTKAAAQNMREPTPPPAPRPHRGRSPARTPGSKPAEGPAPAVHSNPVEVRQALEDAVTEVNGNETRLLERKISRVSTAEEEALPLTLHPSQLDIEPDAAEECPLARQNIGALILQRRSLTPTSVAERLEACPASEPQARTSHSQKPAIKAVVKDKPQAPPAVSSRPPSAAGRLPPVPGPRPGPFSPELLALSPVSAASEDPPFLAEALHHAANGRSSEALQCVFRQGNERTLVALLRCLDASEQWAQLPQADAAYLARLLSALLRKNPLGQPAQEACSWLEALLRVPGGAALLSPQDIPALQGAFFSLSSVGGQISTTAAAAYYHLLQLQNASLPHQVRPLLAVASAAYA